MSLKFWESVEKTDPNFTKKAKVSGQMRTAVDAQYKKKAITRAFGMYGLNWGVVADSERYERIHFENQTCLLNYQATAFYIFDGERAEFPIAAQIRESYVTNNGQGYLKIDDEAVKKVRTDALTKGFTDLGFCADVHMGFFDDQDYVHGARIAAEIEKEEKESEVKNKAYSDIKEWVTTQFEAAKQVKNDASFEKAMNRIAEKTKTRCLAAGISSAGFEVKLKEITEERKNASK